MPEMVVIACKAPNGLVLNLDRYELVDKDRGTIRRIPGDVEIKLRGWSVHQGRVDLASEQGGYALTEVPADQWEKWLAANQDSPLLKDRIILGPPKQRGADSATAQAAAHAEVPQMHARLLQKGDPRLPPIDRVAPDEEMERRKLAAA